MGDLFFQYTNPSPTNQNYSYLKFCTIMYIKKIKVIVLNTCEFNANNNFTSVLASTSTFTMLEMLVHNSNKMNSFKTFTLAE